MVLLALTLFFLDTCTICLHLLLEIKYFNIITTDQKKENTEFASKRVFVEHRIRSIKIFRVVRERFRLKLGISYFLFRNPTFFLMPTASAAIKSKYQFVSTHKICSNRLSNNAINLYKIAYFVPLMIFINACS
jgi:hypothetical protein